MWNGTQIYFKGISSNLYHIKYFELLRFQISLNDVRDALYISTLYSSYANKNQDLFDVSFNRFAYNQESDFNLYVFKKMIEILDQFPTPMSYVPASFVGYDL